LDKSNLRNARVIARPNTKHPLGAVFAILPVTGQRVCQDTEITVFTSNGPDQYQAAQETGAVCVIGQPLEKARELLRPLKIEARPLPLCGVQAGTGVASVVEQSLQVQTGRTKPIPIAALTLEYRKSLPNLTGLTIKDALGRMQSEWQEGNWTFCDVSAGAQGQSGVECKDPPTNRAVVYAFLSDRRTCRIDAVFAPEPSKPPCSGKEFDPVDPTPSVVTIVATVGSAALAGGLLGFNLRPRPSSPPAPAPAGMGTSTPARPRLRVRRDIS
jgi:hypothetical protein